MGSVNVLLPDELHRVFRQLTLLKGTTMSRVLSESARRWVEENMKTADGDEIIKKR